MNTKGFTLTEVALTLGIASFALIAIVGLIPIGMKSTSDTTLEMHAASLLSLMAADVEHTPADKVASPIYNVSLTPATSGTFYTLADASASPTATGAVYRVKWSTQAVPPGDTVAVALTIGWPAVNPVSNRQIVIIPSP